MKRYQILLVDDAKPAQLAFKSILSDFHCDVIVAASGEEAMEECNLIPFDLIVMDLSLPRHNGFEVTERIKTGSLLNKKTPVVALSIHSEAHFAAQIQKSHMQGFISKPLTRFEATELMNHLEQGTL
jgi:two-component system, chemotaxis family, chemotaxis protein CheY